MDDQTQRIVSVFEQLPEMVAIIDPGGLILHANRRLLETMGYALDAIVGTNIFEYVHPDDLAYMAWSWEQREAHRGEVGIPVHGRGRDADGSWRAVEILGISLLGDERVGGMVMSMRDLGHDDASRPDSPARLRSMVDRTTDVLLLVDVEGRIAYANRRLTSRYGHDSDRVIGRPMVSLVHDDDVDEARAWLRSLIDAGDRATSRIRLRLVDPQGEIHQVEWHGTNQVGDPLITGVILSGRDITDLVAMEAQVRDQTEQLEHAASHDPLTGLLNRGAFIDQVVAALRERSEHDEPGEAIVLFCDLDRFKVVNDTYGHEIGDRVLEVVAKRLRSSVAADDLVARYGGDEFTVLLSTDVAPSAVTVLVARLSAAIGEPINIGEVVADVGVSVGISRAPVRQAKVDTMLREADHAMYARKSDRL